MVTGRVNTRRAEDAWTSLGQSLPLLGAHVTSVYGGDLSSMSGVWRCGVNFLKSTNQRILGVLYSRQSHCNQYMFN